MDKQLELTKNKRIALTGAFTALVLVLGITSLGFIRIGLLAITILQIPVLLSILVVGLPSGLFVGTTFGIMSLIQAAISSAGFDVFFLNPICSVLPRILFVLVSWCIWKLLNCISWIPKIASVGITAFLGTVSHTILVMGTVFMIYTEKISANFPDYSSFKAFMIISLPNAILEAVLSTVVCILVFTGIFISNKRKSKLSRIQ